MPLSSLLSLSRKKSLVCRAGVWTRTCRPAGQHATNWAMLHPSLLRNFPVIYCMKKVKCECGVGSNLQSLAPLAANCPLSHCCIAYYRKKLKFRGPKKSRFLGPSPLKCPSLWIVPPQNHFVPAHINTRYINSYSAVKWTVGGGIVRWPFNSN